MFALVVDIRIYVGSQACHTDELNERETELLPVMIREIITGSQSIQWQSDPHQAAQHCSSAAAWFGVTAPLISLTRYRMLVLKSSNGCSVIQLNST